MKEKRSLTETLRHFREGREERLEGGLERFEQIVRSADLDSMVRQALSSSTATVTDVTIRPAQGGIGVGTAVYIVEGTADERGQSRPWAIILKTLAKQPGQEDERGPFYWKREAEFFGSSLSQEMETGFRPPRCFAVQTVSDDEIALWLEYVPHQAGPWTDEQFNRAAHKIGQFGGYWYEAEHRLCERWMNQQRGFVEPWFPLAEENLDAIETQWESFQQMGVSFDDDFFPELQRGCSRCMSNVEIYKSLPPTLCHFDLHPGNLLWNRENPQDLVAIDWAYLGPGALGQDIAFLVGNRIRSGRSLTLAQLCEAGEKVYGHYVDGWRQVGRDGSDDKIRVGYLAYATIWEVGMIVRSLVQALRRDPSERVEPRTFKETVTLQWEYLRQRMSELEALTG